VRTVCRAAFYWVLAFYLMTCLSGCQSMVDAIFDLRSVTTDKTSSQSTQLESKTDPTSAATSAPDVTPSPTSSPAPTKKPIPSPTVTSVPTATPEPTATPAPTPTLAPTATPAPAPTGTAGLDPAQWRSELFRLTNLERTDAGLPALSMGNGGLLEAAGIRADEIVTLFSHTRPDGSDCFSVLDKCGVTFSAAGENIAMATAGYRSPEQVMDMWMGSAGHRANILSLNFTSLGIGYCKAGGSEWFVQIFTG
jgi:uncharacterized protein YkwD